MWTCQSRIESTFLPYVVLVVGMSPTSILQIQGEMTVTGNSVPIDSQTHNERKTEVLQLSSPIECGLGSGEQRFKCTLRDHDQGGHQGLLPPEKLFGPLVCNQIWSPSTTGNSEGIDSPRTPRSFGSAKTLKFGKSELEARGLVWMAACEGFVTAVRGDGVLLAWTIETGERGAPSLLQMDLIAVESQDSIPDHERAGCKGDSGKLRHSMLSSILPFRGREMTDCCDVKVGPQGMWANSEDGIDSLCIWSHRFALLERAGARVLLSAGHPDGAVHSYSIGAGQVSLMQVLRLTQSFEF
jgi:hypothetical protein